MTHRSIDSLNWDEINLYNDEVDDADNDIKSENNEHSDSRVDEEQTEGSIEGCELVEEAAPVSYDETEEENSLVLATFEDTDIWLANRFVHEYEPYVKFCGKQGWCQFNGKRWVSFRKELVANCAEELVCSLLAEAHEIDDPADKDKRLGFLENARRTSGTHDRMVKIASRRPVIHFDENDFNKRPWLFNVSNGTLDFQAVEDRFRGHQPGDFLRCLCPMSFNPDAVAPKWKKFITEIMNDDQDMVRYLKAVLGSCLIGINHEQALYFLYGYNGKNGKSTLAEVIRRVLGQTYCTAIDAAMLAKKLNREATRNDLATIRATRLVFCSELDKGSPLDDGLVKQLTGNDMVVARAKYHDSFSYSPEFKVFVQTNYLPEINGNDSALLRRIHIIPFERTFPMTPGLVDDLAAEGEGILRWLVEGAFDYVSGGCQILKPEKVKELEAGYRAKYDSVGAFFDLKYLIGDSSNPVLRTALFSSYKSFCKERELHALGRKEFNATTRHLGGDEGRDRQRNHIWENISARPGALSA